jgi:SAM-dependent methyltransferase
MPGPDLSARRLESELMDDPGLDPERHEQALRALARVNRVSLGWSRVARAVERLRAEGGGGAIRVLDVACGGGDVLLALARWARRRGLAVELHGCDVSAVALEHARRLAHGEVDVRFFHLDVLHDPLPDGYDLLCTSLFLHHLSDEAAVKLLRAMGRSTRRALLVQDLRRTRAGYVLARLGLLALTRSDVARRDGPASVQAAFTLREAAALCGSAGLSGARVRSAWPQRLVIEWHRETRA